MSLHQQLGKCRASTWHCQRDGLQAHLLHMQAAVCTTGDLMLPLCADIEPDLKVRAAMNEINAAQRLRRAERHAMIAPLSKSHSLALPSSHALG